MSYHQWYIRYGWVYAFAPLIVAYIIVGMIWGTWT